MATEFTGRQKALFEALRDLDPRLAEMYEGALRVLDDHENPSRLPFCAHGLREIVDKLPKYLDLPVPAKQASLGAKVNEIHDEWKQAVQKSGCTSDGAKWDGPIDKPLSR